jgi:hypothetical protein
VRAVFNRPSSHPDSTNLQSPYSLPSRLLSAGCDGVAKNSDGMEGGGLDAEFKGGDELTSTAGLEFL